jgi:5'(3')-deoxyribonucleotidase
MGKRINLDVDGVVCDFVPYLWERLAKAGFEVSHHSDPKWRTWNIFDVMDTPAREKAYSICNSENFWLDLPTVPYAAEAVNAFRDAGHSIRWVTTPWWGCRTWTAARFDWLDRNFKHPKQNLKMDFTTCGDKSEIWADVFIDDKAEAVIDWHKHHPAPKHRGILYKTNFNHGYHSRADLENIEWTPESVLSILEWLESK